jgi:hypothetical protein
MGIVPLAGPEGFLMSTLSKAVKLSSPKSADLPPLAESGGPQITIYLPTHASPLPARQDSRRLEQLLEQAQELLLLRGGEFGATGQSSALSSLRGLAATLASLPAVTAGIALFAAPDLSHAFRLNRPPREMVLVDDHFFLRPLLDSLDEDTRCYGVALSLKTVRLLTCDEHGTSKLPGLVPAGMQAALGYTAFDTGTQTHSANPRALGSRSAVVHGHGGGDSDNLDDDVRQYLRRVALGLRGLPEVSVCPPVISSVSELFDLLRQEAPDLHLLYSGTGNADHLTDREIGELSRGVCEQTARDGRRYQLSETLERSGPGGASDVLEEILPAAAQARIQTLFLARGCEIRGRYDVRSGRLERLDHSAPPEWDLLDLAARLTLQRGGRVVTLAAADFPPGRVIAARFRYT